MVYLFKEFARTAVPPTPPTRRRAIIIGAGPTGVAAAFHLGAHSLLLLRGETRLGANVVRIRSSQHLLTLADGTRFVYDKLLSSIAIHKVSLCQRHPARDPPPFGVCYPPTP